MLRWARTAVAGIPLAVGIVYLLSTTFNLLTFNHDDLNHTVGSSYAYLFGHGVDFYDYNAIHFGVNDYFPTTYILFAVWMAPVKLLLSPGEQNGLVLSGYEVAWAKLLLLLLFWATFIVVSKIAKELFPGREASQTTVRIAFLLSPLAAFAFNVFGQYDILGVLFTALGFLYYLRGDKWRFAIFFALAISSKYFALIILIPLIVLQFKKLRDIVLIGLVSISVLVVEGLVYLPNVAFREHTLFSLVGGKLSGAGGQTVTVVVGVVFIVGCIVLWRLMPTPPTIGPLAVFTVVVVYGMMFTVVTWHPQWFILLTPFFAMSLGYLRRRALFLIWDSLFVLVFIWIVGNTWVDNVDLTMIEEGALHEVLGDPLLLISDFYPLAAVPILHVVLVFYLFSPLAFLLIERARVSTAPIDGTRTPAVIWILRVAILPLTWTLPAIIAIVIPASLAVEINPRAETVGMGTASACSTRDVAYGPVHDGIVEAQTFSGAADDLSGISFLVATYAHESDGDLNLRLVDADGDERARTTIDLATVADNSLQYFTFPAIADSADNKFTLEVTTRDISADAESIAIWGSAADCDTVGTLELKGTLQGGDLAMTTYYRAR